MQRGRGRAHEDRALLERDCVRQQVRVLRRHADEFRETAVAVLADHLPGRAELLATGAAVAALAAGDEVVQAHAVARTMRRNAGADGFNDARDLVAQRERMAGRTDAGAVMRIRMADARRLHAHEHFAGTRCRGSDVLVRERPAGRRQADGTECRTLRAESSFRRPILLPRGRSPWMKVRPLGHRQGGIGPRPAVAGCNPSATPGS